MAPTMSFHIDRRPDYDVAGPPDAPAIVFVHGSVVTRTLWRPQLAALADQFRVLAPDLPGHGSAKDIPFTFASAAEAIARLIREQKERRAIVVGLSLGGYVAIEATVRYQELVTGLVLCGTSVNFRSVLGAYLRTVSWLMHRGVIRVSEKKMAEKTRRLFPPTMADVADLQIRDGVYPAALAPAFAEMGRKDFVAMLSSVRCRTLIVNGEFDKPARRGEKAFAEAAHAEIRTIAGARHACNLDQPEAFNAVVREFATSLQVPNSESLIPSF